MTAPARTLQDIAEALVHARRQVASVQPGTVRVAELAEGLAVAATVHEEWSRAGAVANGIKIGFTTRAKWTQLAISGPFWGRTYTDTTVTAGADPVPLDRCVAPRLEAEVVFGLSRDLVPGADVEQVAHAIEWGALAFEIVDSHAQWKTTPAALVADFGAHAGLVIGPRRSLTAQQALDLSDLSVELTCGDDEPVRGHGADVLDGPVSAVAILLAAPGAPALPAGSLISTGALTGTAHPVRPGQAWRLHALDGLLESTSLSFAISGGPR